MSYRVHSDKDSAENSNVLASAGSKTYRTVITEMWNLDEENETSSLSSGNLVLDDVGECLMGMNYKL